MALALPYHFDSSGVVKTILRFTLGLLGVVVIPGIAYSLVISPNRLGAVLLVGIGVMVILFGRAVLKQLPGAHGIVTADAVVVLPTTLCGLRLAGGHPGTYRMEEFEAVRVDRWATPAFAQGGPHAVVSLVGRAGTPDIPLARIDRDAGLSLGKELATALRLPYREEQAAY
jgi:hypothetical protein